MRPSSADKERLAQKYKTLGDLRRAKASGEALPERVVFRDLAAAFPGALNELDTLPLEEIDRRAAALERSARARGGEQHGGEQRGGEQRGGEQRGGEQRGDEDNSDDNEPWIAWIHAYHALVRAALDVRRRVAGDRRRASETGARLALPPERAASIAEACSERAGVRVDAAFVEAVLHPPGGRINAVVYERLAAFFGVPAHEIKRALFPGLRRTLS